MPTKNKGKCSFCDSMAKIKYPIKFKFEVDNTGGIGGISNSINMCKACLNNIKNNKETNNDK